MDCPKKLFPGDQQSPDQLLALISQRLFSLAKMVADKSSLRSLKRVRMFVRLNPCDKRSNCRDWKSHAICDNSPLPKSCALRTLR